MWMILFGRIAQFLLMLATLKMATSLLTPAEMGKIALITTVIAFISSFLINPVGMYINRQLHRWQSEGVVTKYMTCQYGYILVVALSASLVIGCLCGLNILHLHFSAVFVMAFIFLTLFFNTINQTAIPSLNLLGFRGWFTVLSIASVLIGLLFAILFVIDFKAKSEYWLSGILAGQVILALIGAWIFHIKTNKSAVVPLQIDSKQATQSVFQFAWPIAIAVGLTWFQSQSYRFFIEDAFGLSTLGVFVAGYGISAGIMAGFESVFVTYFQPIFYAAVSESSQTNRAKAWNQYALAIIPSVLLLTFTLSALSNKLTLLMLAPSFKKASQFVMWGAFSEACRVIGNVYNMVAHAEQDTKMLILPNFIGAVVCLSAIYGLTPQFGIIGVAASLVLAGLIVLVFLHVRMKKRLDIAIPYDDIGRAILFGILIWILHVTCDHLLQKNISTVIAQFGVIGLFFMLAEYCLLKNRSLSKQTVF